MAGKTYLAYDYPILGAFWTLLLLAATVLWFTLLFRVILDVFRDDELSGSAKAGWLLFVIVLPFLGVFVYVIARGRQMGQRETERALARQGDVDAYIRATAGSGTSHADQLTRLAEMHDKGDITDAEFVEAKTRVLA